MKTLFLHKTNKKALHILSVKSQIRVHAAALRHHEQRTISPSVLGGEIDSELFRRHSIATEFQVVGREPGI